VQLLTAADDDGRLRMTFYIRISFDLSIIYAFLHTHISVFKDLKISFASKNVFVIIVFSENMKIIYSLLSFYGVRLFAYVSMRSNDVVLLK
jgi:hypothetical protein